MGDQWCQDHQLDLKLNRSTVVLNLLSFKIAEGMWDSMKGLLSRNSISTRRFQLEYEISEYSQGDKSILDDYSGFINLWTEFTKLVYAMVPNNAISALQKVHEISQRDQLFMKLWREYESVCSCLISRACPLHWLHALLSFLERGALFLDGMLTMELLII